MKQKGKKRTIIAFAALFALVVLFCIVWWIARPTGTAGQKNFTLTIVHADGSEKTLQYETDAEYVGKVLLDDGLIAGEEGTYGLYILTVDGESAIYEEDQAYWAFYEDGTYATQSVDATPIRDGTTYSLVYTVG